MGNTHPPLWLQSTVLQERARAFFRRSGFASLPSNLIDGRMVSKCLRTIRGQRRRGRSPLRCRMGKATVGSHTNEVLEGKHAHLGAFACCGVAVHEPSGESDDHNADGGSVNPHNVYPNQGEVAGRHMARLTPWGGIITPLVHAPVRVSPSCAFRRRANRCNAPADSSLRFVCSVEAGAWYPLCKDFIRSRSSAVACYTGSCSMVHVPLAAAMADAPSVSVRSSRLRTRTSFGF